MTKNYNLSHFVYQLQKSKNVNEIRESNGFNPIKQYKVPNVDMNIIYGPYNMWTLFRS